MRTLSCAWSCFPFFLFSCDVTHCEKHSAKLMLSGFHCHYRYIKFWHLVSFLTGYSGLHQTQYTSTSRLDTQQKNKKVEDECDVETGSHEAIDLTTDTSSSSGMSQEGSIDRGYWCTHTSSYFARPKAHCFLFVLFVCLFVCLFFFHHYLSTEYF